MKLQLVVLVIALSATSAVAKTTSKHLVPMSQYNCSGKPNGNYDHPTDCTKFISCSNNYAYEMNCAACHISEGPDRCPEGKLHYYAPLDRCEWANVANCTRGPAPTTELPTTTTRTPPPTETPVITDAPVTPTSAPGEACDPNDCKHIGECTWFKRCDKTTSEYVKFECDDDLFWNPDWNANEQGGNCDQWDNLSQAVQDQYRSDPECFPPCYYEENGSCSGTFKFHEPETDHRQILELNCPPTLVWDHNRETCGRCSNVRISSSNATSAFCC